MTRTPSPSSDLRAENLARLEVVLATLLRAGVVVSVVLMLAGVLVSFMRHPDYMTDPHTLARLTTPGAAFPHDPRTLISEVLHVRGRAIMTLGLLVLIATPVLRVAASVVAFLLQRNWRFAIVTSLVLTVLLISMLLGKVE